MNNRRDKTSLRELMLSPDSEPLEGSLTNELVLTEQGTVVKKFSKRPLMAYVQMLGRVPSGNMEFQHREFRIENERDFREYVKEMGIRVPDILEVEGDLVEFEKVEGMNMYQYLNEFTGEALESGKKVGKFLDMLHDTDAAITDMRINNFMIQDDGGLAFVDAEYFSRDATGWEKRMDLITMISSLKQVKPEAYTEFREGFNQEFEYEIGLFTEIVSSFTAPLHALLLERDIQRLKRALSNIWNDLGD